jgi:ribosome-interacting GTPase 1
MQAKKEMWVVTFAIFIEIFNADVLIREDITVDQFIDVVLGNRKYLTCVYVRHICTLVSSV